MAKTDKPESTSLAESFLLGVAASSYAANEVLLALTLVAIQTRNDFTMMGGILISCLMALLIFGVVHGNIVTLIYYSLGAVLFSIYLIYDTQLMMGGEHTYSISREEYIFAALNLFLDILNIFMDVLKIISMEQN